MLQADFSFFFDTGGRRRCYLAPERFYSPSDAPEGEAPLQPAMVGWLSYTPGKHLGCLCMV